MAKPSLKSTFLSVMPHQKTVSELEIEYVVYRIEKKHEGLAAFWGHSQGWAPVEAAGILTAAKLDWLHSLAGSLRKWHETGSLTDGDLILAWANLGSLVEGAIKILLSVWYELYKADIDALIYANAYNNKKKTHVPPQDLTLDPLRKFCKAKHLLTEDELNFVQLVQDRRNAIHSFKERPIGTYQEFERATRSYLLLLRSIDKRLPYPNDEYRPREL